ncbi:MAG: TonB-dependent receptor plug domain-containing protein [Candidatus Methylomirabilia bacterium]
MSAIRIAGAAGVIVALVLGPGAGVAAQRQTLRSEPAAVPSTSLSLPAGGVIGSLDVVTAEQIAATAAPDIRAALALVPTLVVDDTGGPAGLVTLSLRGSNSRQVLVLVDGQRVSREPGAAFNVNDLAVPVDRIARIEVMPAPASVIYGPDAVGGVVNIVTRPAGVTPALAISYGRGAEAEQRLAGGVQYGFKKLGLRLEGELHTGDGLRDNGDYDQKSFVLGLAVSPAPWGLDLRWTSFKRESGVPGPAAHPSKEARQKDAADGLRADVVYQPGGNWGFKAGVFSRSQSLRFADPVPPVVDPLVPSLALALRRENSSSGIDARLDFDTKGGELYTVGAEWVDDRIKSDSDEGRSTERWSVFTQDQWRNGAWSAVLALRRDQHSVYGGRTNPSLSVGWGSGGWKLWTAWARTSRTPSFDELYLDEQFLKGNPDLKTETSESFDGGIELGGPGGRVRLSGFRRSVDNLIGWADGDGDLVCRPGNVAHATTSGWEAEVLYRPSASIAIPVGYQRLSSQDGETRASLPGAVRSIWRVAVQGVGSSLTWSLEYAATDRGEFQRRGGSWNYAVVNAALAWRDKIFSVPVQLSLRAENLQDRAYETVEDYPMRGRSWFAEVKVGL